VLDFGDGDTEISV